MNEKTYVKICSWFEQNSSRRNFIKSIHDILPLIMYLTYPLLLVSLYLQHSDKLLKILIVPASVFVFITVSRYIFNAKRPYEKYDFNPVIDKKTKGKSFPSRHTASAFIIAMAFLYYQTNLGLFMMAIALLIGVSRVLVGVHFIRDVFFGALFSIVVGALAFFVF